MFSLAKFRTMTVPTRAFFALLLALSLLVCCSCTSQTSDPGGKSNPGATETPTAPENDPDETPREQVVVELPPPKDTKPTGIPAVKLSETVKATCKVGVGDAFPRLDGFPEKWGTKATVVAFFTTGTKPMSKMKAKEILEDLQTLGAAHTDGLSVVAVDVADKQESLAQTDFTLLYDENSELFGAVATGAATPPRLFLLDPEGKILWMDTEYSQATRAQLRQSLDSLIGAPAGT